MLAASGVFASGTAWPDLAVAIVMAGLALSSSYRVILQASRRDQERFRGLSAAE